MNNFAVITKAEQDVAKAKAHLSVLKQKINDSKAKLEEAKKDYDDNINAVSSDNSGIHEYILSVDLIKVELNKAKKLLKKHQKFILRLNRRQLKWETDSII